MLASANLISLIEYNEKCNIGNLFVEKTLIPLVFADAGEKQVIKKIGGNDEIKHHLENLGFTVGATVTVVNSLAGNIIVKVKESRIAINEEMAQKIMV